MNPRENYVASSDHQNGNGSFNLTATGGPTKLAFSTLAHTGVVNQCLGPITVQSQNASGVATNVTATTTVNLVSDATGTFHATNACGATVTSVSIPSGSNSATVYYKPTSVGDGTHLLTASATGLASATQTQTINKANQTITFAQPTTPRTFGDTFTVNPTASSGLASSSSPPAAARRPRTRRPQAGRSR